MINVVLENQAFSHHIDGGPYGSQFLLSLDLSFSGDSSGYTTETVSLTATWETEDPLKPGYEVLTIDAAIDNNNGVRRTFPVTLRAAAPGLDGCSITSTNPGPGVPFRVRVFQTPVQ